MTRKVTYLDLFSGAGGFALGLKQAGFRFMNHYFSEIDTHAVANYQYNFPHARQLGDIKQVGTAKIEAPDIISFGSPCQDLSIAGGRTGIKGEKSSLFFEAVRLIKKYRPRVFLFENVKGLLSSNEGKDFEVVLETLADIGLYEIEWQLVDSAWFLPQQRQRIYLVGHLRGQPFRQIFPLTKGDQLPEAVGGKGQRREDIASTITSTYSKGVHGRGETYVRTKSKRLRRLTPVECERLQGFPDHWTAYGSVEGEQQEIPDTQRYRLMGNAVSVAVVKAIAKKILHAQTFLGNTDMAEQSAITPTADQRGAFVELVRKDLLAKKPHTKITLEKIAAGFGIGDKNDVKELTELAIVETARRIALLSEPSIEEKYRRIVDLYHNQVNLSHRTSQSILLQQYSTPAPIGYLMGIFCRIDRLHETGGYAFEPSAGNGLLTIAARPNRVYVNEVDEQRRNNLRTQGFANVWDRDAAKPFFDVRRNFMAVLTNPPFGMLDTKMLFDGYPIQPLEHVMAIYALDCMVSEGKAAIIIGGHTGWDKKGRIAQGKNRLFLNYLYHHYYVADVIQINGKKLYSRQGTGFNTRLILINGRKQQPEGAAPVHEKERDAVINSFEDLYDRVMAARDHWVPPPVSKGNSLRDSYTRYLKVQSNHPDAFLLLDNDNQYEVFGDHALWLAKNTDLILSAELLHEGKRIPLVRVQANRMPEITELLRRHHIRSAVADTLLSPQQIEMDKMENEAKKLLAALRSKSLGSTEYNAQQELYRQIYEYEYLPLWDQHNQAMIFLLREGNYEVYGWDTNVLSKFFSIEPTSTFIYEEQEFKVTVIAPDRIHSTVSRLRKMGFRFIVSDDPKLSWPVNRKDKLTGKFLWEMTRKELYASEEREFNSQVRKSGNPLAYDLPYAPEYVAMFNSALTGDPYEHAPLNPYCTTGKEQLQSRSYRETCLESIHQYNIRLAMKLDIVVADEVIKDYPKLKLRQDARVTYLKTIVGSGNQLNGTGDYHKPDYEIVEEVLKETASARPMLSGLSGKGHFDDDEIVDHDELFEEFLRKKAENPKPLYLFETPETFVAFNEDAEALARTCKVGLIKTSKNGSFRYFITASSKSLLFIRIPLLEEAGYKPLLVENPRYHSQRNKDKVDLELNRILKIIDDSKKQGELGAPYEPASNACIVLDTQVPDSMAYETQEALAQIKEAVGGDVDNFVRDRLGYPTKTALCKALSAEQTDAVMMAIYNIEARGQGMIIGDQTGIGKGRVAAGIIRYACHQGLKPVFLTEKANLFSDIYRDLYAIGSGRLKPFIVNGRESKTDIKDEDGNVVYQALPYQDQQSIFSSRALPANFDFVVATYTQFNSPDKKPEKPAFLSAIAEDNIFILDEAHNSSGSSNTGNFLQGVVARTKGVVFLSATFAKRPDNMPIYAMKTAISDCNMSRDQLVESIQRGGVALQEVLSSQLVAEGQMLRRERSFEGVEVNYITLTDKSVEHQAIADNITAIIRDIIKFQKDYIDVIVEELDDIAVADGKQIDLREGTSQAGVDNMPYFSKVFNIINQMLFSIKAISVAERAIERLKEGKKPIIAFSSTMGSFLEDMDDENGLPVADGSTINPDFSEVLRRGLDGVMRYTEKDINGQPEYKKFEISELSPEAQQSYYAIQKKIEQISTGITLSPIDIVIKKIRDAGYSVAEVTGRKFELQMNADGTRAVVMARRRINTNDAFRQFNNNEIDVLMINQSGSTGASAHAIATAKVSKDEVRQRVMIVLQAELDINTEVQKRGRINRTGQLIKPIYDYITSAIPAEMRLMMMLQKKLKSLDANTASNQKQSTKILDVPDFLNKYGDRVVKEYLLENAAVNAILDDPLRLKNTTDSDQGDADAMENAAHKVSGRVAVLSVQMQQDFYSEITDRYNDYVAYLQQIGEYDLELEAMNLQAETMNSKVVKMGSGSGSLFSEDSILETVKVNVLKKPFTTTELENLLNESLQGEDPRKMQQDIIKDYHEETGMALEIDEKEIQERHNEMDKRIYLEKKFQKLKTEAEQDEYVRKREQEIEEARQKALKVLREKSAARSYYLEKIFKFFYVGRNLNFPVDNFNGYKEYVPTVFLGFVIDWKRKNPFLPSKIKLRFALANSNKYFAMPASYDDVDKIIGASSDVPQLSREQLLQNWGQYIQENNTDRKTRHIVTGNLLQAFSDFRGKLVNYTTLDDKINKGILLPENWVADEQVQDKVSIPVYKALPLIRSLVNGKSIITSTGIGFLRQPEWYKIIVPMSRKVAGDIYLDKDLLALIDTNNFNRVSDKMVGMLDEKNIEKFVAIVQDKHNCSVTITRHQFNSMEKQASAMRNRKPIRMPEPEKAYQPEDDLLELLELEAEALKLKLRLKLRLAA